MTREEARRIAALHWLFVWDLVESSGSRIYRGDELRMIQYEKQLIRRRLQRLAKPKARNKP